MTSTMQGPVASQLLSVRADQCVTRKNGRSERYEDFEHSAKRQY